MTRMNQKGNAGRNPKVNKPKNNIYSLLFIFIDFFIYPNTTIQTIIDTRVIT